MKSIAEPRQKFTQLSLFADDQAAAMQRLEQRLQQTAQVLADILNLVAQSIHNGKPTPLAAAILRLAARHQGEVSI